MSTTSIVYLFVILAVVNSERYIDGGEKTTVDAELSVLKHFINEQNQLNNVLLEKVDMLVQQNQKLTTKNKHLEDQNQQRTAKTSHLEDKNQQLTAKTKHLEDKNQQLTAKTNHLEDQLQQLATKTNHLEDQIQQLTTKTNHLEDQNQQLTAETKHLEDQNQQLTAETKHLGVQNQRLTEQTALQNVDIATMKAELKLIHEGCMETQGPNKRLLLMNQPQPQYELRHTTAFSATLGQHHQTGLGNQQTIIFDDAITNVGNAYSPVTGVFTATTNGTFFFFVSILGFYGDYVEAEIVRNGIQVAATYSKDTNAHDQGSNAAALVLTQGDKVWVRHINTEGTQVSGYKLSSFTGFQV